MDVILNFNGVNYILRLHELDIWTHSATVSELEMSAFISQVLKNNPKIAALIKKEI